MVRLLVMLLTVLCSTTTCYGREWTTASGEYSFEGEFVQYVTGHIAVKVGDKVLKYPEQAYSKADIQYAKEHQSKEDRETDLAIKKRNQEIEKLRKVQEKSQEIKNRTAAYKARKLAEYASELSNWLASKVRIGRSNVKSTYGTLHMYRSMRAHYVVGNLSLIESLNRKNSELLDHLEASTKALRMKANPTEGWLLDQQKRIRILLNDAAENEKIIEQERKKIRMIPKPDP
jgi:hypothetical protein